MIRSGEFEFLCLRPLSIRGQRRTGEGMEGVVFETVEHGDPYLSFTYRFSNGALELLSWTCPENYSSVEAIRDDEDLLNRVADRRAEFLHAFIGALFGTDTGGPGSDIAISIDDVVANAKNWVSELPSSAQRDINFGCQMLELVLGPHFPQSTIAKRQSLITSMIAEPEFGFLRPLGRVRTVFYGAYFEHPKTWARLGFVEPQHRPHAPAFSEECELRCTGLMGRNECDWVVIGSGCGGAAAATALASQGKDGVVLERGEYWPVKRIRHNDLEQFARIYVDGGLQSSASRDLAILQVQCIGGSSLINNCIIFRPTEVGWTHPNASDVLEEWQQEFGVVIDRERLKQSFDHIEARLEVHPITDRQAGPNGDQLLQAWSKFLDGPYSRPTDKDAPSRLFKKNYGTVERTCWACGYCNSGCPYYRKNSVAQTLLADAELAGVRIVPESDVRWINFSENDPARATSVTYRFGGQDAYVHSRQGVVVAAGVGASSTLLQSSGFDEAGQRLSCNLACPVIARVPRLANSWNGLQMASYVDRGDHMFESWFHPPATFSASMGGWFGEYLRRMHDYSKLVCFAVMIPVSDFGVIEGNSFVVSLQECHLQALREHIVDVVHLHFAGGADEVYLPTPKSITISRADAKSVKSIVEKELRHTYDFILSTAHPQGGNPMGTDRETSVVGPDLKVHGTTNLYVADASVFPSSIRVNPQLTIMGLVHSHFSAA